MGVTGFVPRLPRFSRPILHVPKNTRRATVLEQYSFLVRLWGVPLLEQQWSFVGDKPTAQEQWHTSSVSPRRHFGLDESVRSFAKKSEPSSERISTHAPFTTRSYPKTSLSTVDETSNTPQTSEFRESARTEVRGSHSFGIASRFIPLFLTACGEGVPCCPDSIQYDCVRCILCS